jgi:hypothetical protein
MTGDTALELIEIVANRHREGKQFLKNRGKFAPALNLLSNHRCPRQDGGGGQSERPQIGQPVGPDAVHNTQGAMIC